MLEDLLAGPAPRVALLNFTYRAELEGFDTARLDAFTEGKAIGASREYFYLVDGRPHLCVWLEWRPSDEGPGTSYGSSDAPQCSRSVAADRASRHVRANGAEAAALVRGPGALGVRAGRGSAPPKGAALDAEPAGEALTPARDASEQAAFDVLRAWRAGEAKKLGVPAYRVLTDRVMDRIVRAKPGDAAALRALEGVGAKTIEAHGDAILRKLRHSAARNAVS